MDHEFISYLKDRVAENVSLCMKGEKMIQDGDRSFSLKQELHNVRRHTALLLNALKKLGVSEQEREDLINPIKKEV